MMSDHEAIENLGHENRHFAPSADFASQAIAKPELYEQAKANRLEFWAEQAKKLHWHKPFTKTLDFSDAPFARWFEDGELNVAFNCLDRHVLAGNGDHVALYFEGEPGDTKTYTYAQLTHEVKKAANALHNLGVEPGDRVAIYLPMIPEAVISMLAVARLGAIHSVIFGGFSDGRAHVRTPVTA
jgi:acetyl-CoA synthetase